ncbi:PDR/VanB family oxidoreductase [Aromatoleum petrolei]|uniref:2Fe-2S iron-sulfur cluster binding domain-containing protein n=1 Tax=Aromatoleum petrolei TaxID=76116 RepID=A0ABX1MM40_9RHOO|nr:PDR/VanB family oxidoreductase [Aromatoleum petrolei]NMF89030.1 2Fe-2S iron-sulfur cluster binding domain-containing protein [Aromatoleum petrolei]
MTTDETVTMRVEAMRYEAEGILSIELAAPDGAELPVVAAGAHVDLFLPNGIARSYSLVVPRSSPRAYVVGVLLDRSSRGGSRYIHEQLRVGQEIPVSRPRNHFVLDEDAGDTVLLAGGIGITPIYSMYARLVALGRPVRLLYSVRSRRQAAFARDIERLGGATDWHIDDEAGGPPDLKAYLARFDAKAHFYCCGPTPMIDRFEAVCEELGYPNVHVERFAARTDQAPAEGGGAYELVLQRSRRSLHVAAGESLISVLQANRIEVPFNCQEGVCGSCETRIIEGEADHRDSVLSKAERAANKSMMVCVSGCKGARLVLDL